MKTRVLVSSVLAGGLALGASFAADKASQKGKDAMSPSDEMMAAYMKVATPGEHHDYLKPLAGSWRTVAKMWTAPDQMQISEGDCETEWVMGGRYLKEVCTGTMQGQPFSGMGLSGYDNMGKKYVGSWIDTMGTGILNWEGSLDSTRKVLTSTTTVMNPMTGKKDKVKMVTKIIDKDKHVFSMYGIHDGKESLEFELTYTRK